MMMLPGLIQERGYNYTAIESVFEIEGIDRGRRRGIFQQVLKLLDVVSKERQKRTDNHGAGE